MLFLIGYDRPSGRIVDFHTFGDFQRREAADERLALEIRLLQQGIEREVAIFEASTEAALRKTHRRYFEDVGGLTGTG